MEITRSDKDTFILQKHIIHKNEIPIYIGEMVQYITTLYGKYVSVQYERKKTQVTNGGLKSLHARIFLIYEFLYFCCSFNFSLLFISCFRNSLLFKNLQ